MIPADPLRNLGPATILRTDARALPLADNSVDLVVTSPPYFALRSYQDAGEHYAAQLGSEATPAEFVDALIDCTREMVRVVKPSGSIFVNLGDKFAGNHGTDRSRMKLGGKAWQSVMHAPKANDCVPPKSLVGIPWRYALRCIDDLGLILRAEIIWSKPNGLPESVTDRVRRSHEQWFHFTLQPRYYSAVDEIREATNPSVDRDYGKTNGARGDLGASNFVGNPLGKLPGSVWTIPTEPLRVPDHLGVDHFAAFPSAWPKRIIRGWSPAGVCTACGEGRRPVTDGTKIPHYAGGSKGARNGMRREGTPHDDDALPRTNTLVTITGYTCPCDGDGYRTAAGLPLPPTVPAVILDPFGGTGTVAMVARALGRHGIHADLSADYNRLARWRITDLDQLAAVQGHERTKREPDSDDLLTLLDDGGAT